MNIPSFLVAMWFLPVTVFIIIPLIICTGWLLYRAIADLAAGEIPFGAYLANRYYQGGEVQRRCEERKPMVDRLTAVISSGNNSVTALIANVSQAGLCLQELPAALETRGGLVSILLDNNSQEIRLAARQCWQKEYRQNLLMAGMAIEVAPRHWQEFVLAIS